MMKFKIFTKYPKVSTKVQLYTGFTLAEVLIALAVIGIIAAMTIPSLVNKIQNHEYVVALKKNYSMLNSGFAQMLTDDGVDKLDDTTVFQSLKSSITLSQAMSLSNQPFFNNLHKYFKFDVMPAPAGSFGFGGTPPILVMADGSIIYSGTFYKSARHGDSERLALIASEGGHMYSDQCELWIDINGLKKPNVKGRDQFFFYITGDGKVYPMYSKDWSIYYYGDLQGAWQNNPSLCGSEGSTDIGSGNCAARIIDDGWQMNY